MKNARFSLRRATVVDAPAMWAVRVDAIRRTCRGHYPDELLERWSSSPMPDTFPSSIEKEYFVVAMIELRIAGFAALKKASAEIDAVFVSPGAGRRGVGRKLVMHLENAAAESGLQSLRLNSSLNAVPLYRAVGYSEVSRGVYTTSAGVQIACVCMEKRLARQA